MRLSDSSCDRIRKLQVPRRADPVSVTRTATERTRMPDRTRSTADRSRPPLQERIGENVPGETGEPRSEDPVQVVAERLELGMWKMELEFRALREVDPMQKRSDHGLPVGRGSGFARRPSIRHALRSRLHRSARGIRARRDFRTTRARVRLTKFILVVDPGLRCILCRCGALDELPKACLPSERTDLRRNDATALLGGRVGEVLPVAHGLVPLEHLPARIRRCIRNDRTDERIAAARLDRALLRARRRAGATRRVAPCPTVLRFLQR